MSERELQKRHRHVRGLLNFFTAALLVESLNEGTQQAGPQISDTISSPVQGWVDIVPPSWKPLSSQISDPPSQGTPV